MDDAIREQKAGKKEQPLIERDENFVDIGGVKLEVNMGKKRQFGSLPQIISPRKDPKH